MANEILVSSISGLSPYVQIYSGINIIGLPIPLDEIDLTGEYVGSMPQGLLYGKYIIIASTIDGHKIGSGEIFWDGNYEVDISLGMLQGLDKHNPMTVTHTSRVSGDIMLTITGDGVNTSIVTRN